MNFLKNHPFAVEAFFENSTVFTFAIPKEQLQKFIPDHLTLDTFKDRWAFIAVAMVKTKNLRPKGFPKWIGNDFFLIGYRIFVRYKTRAGKNLRGLYILKSETNKKKMELLGNVFTHYNYTTTDIHFWESDDLVKIESKKSDFQVTIDPNAKQISLPQNSPFSEWKEARRFAGPLPFTFSCNPDDNSVLIIEGVRQNWKPQPIKVNDYNFSFLQSLDLKDVILANAFEITEVPYYWKKGRKEIWK